METHREKPEPRGAVPPSLRARSENRKRAALISIRLLPDEAARLREAAAEAGYSLSGFIRNAALAAASGSTFGPRPASRTGSTNHGEAVARSVSHTLGHTGTSSFRFAPQQSLTGTV